jgi:hypothetical protein
VADVLTLDPMPYHLFFSFLFCSFLFFSFLFFSFLFFSFLFLRAWLVLCGRCADACSATVSPFLFFLFFSFSQVLGGTLWQMC